MSGSPDSSLSSTCLDTTRRHFRKAKVSVVSLQVPSQLCRVLKDDFLKHVFALNADPVAPQRFNFWLNQTLQEGLCAYRFQQWSFRLGVLLGRVTLSGVTCVPSVVVVRDLALRARDCPPLHTYAHCYSPQAWIPKMEGAVSSDRKSHFLSSTRDSKHEMVQQVSVSFSIEIFFFFFFFHLILDIFQSLWT